MHFNFKLGGVILDAVDTGNGIRYVASNATTQISTNSLLSPTDSLLNILGIAQQPFIVNQNGIRRCIYNLEQGSLRTDTNNFGIQLWQFKSSWDKRSITTTRLSVGLILFTVVNVDGVTETLTVTPANTELTLVKFLSDIYPVHAEQYELSLAE